LASGRPLVAVVGGDTLLAKEIRDLFEEASPAPRLQLISAAADGSSIISADEGAEDEEAIVMVPLSAESLVGAQVALLAGSAASSRRTLKVNPQSGPRLIDLAGSLEDQPDARLRAPMAEPAGAPPSGKVQVIAHPAAIALVMLLSRAARTGAIRRSVAHIFEPASERGKKGIEELQKQTVAVLSFQKLPTDVFDTQLAFNMLARYGEEAVEPLEDVEHRIERHVASLLTGWSGIPMPSLRLIQAPVFHGHSISVWIEFEQSPGIEAISNVLAGSDLDVRTEEPPTNAGAAGQDGASVGAISQDRNNPRAYWFWMVADNLRLAAENGVAVARELL
jgi:aspartate-semialdehyde dehydrogenase